MKQRKVKIEILPPGIVYSPSIKDKYFSDWRLEIIGEGKGKDLIRESYLRTILKGVQSGNDRNIIYEGKQKKREEIADTLVKRNPISIRQFCGSHERRRQKFQASEEDYKNGEVISKVYFKGGVALLRWMSNNQNKEDLR